MLSPKYMKKFLQESEEAARKYVLKGTGGLEFKTSIKGFSENLIGGWPKEFTTSYNLPPSFRKTAQERLEEVPVKAAPPTGVVTASKVKNDLLFQEKALEVSPIVNTKTDRRDPKKKDGLKRRAIGLGMAGAITASIFSGMNVAPKILNTPISVKPASELSSAYLEKAGKDQNLSKQTLDKILESNRVLYHEDVTKPEGAFVNLFHNGSSLKDAMNLMGPQKGYNLFGGHGTYNIGVVKGASREEAKSLGVEEGKLYSSQGIADLIRNSENYNADLPVKMLNCEVGKAHVAQEVADILGTPVLASTENLWGSSSRGFSASAKTGADGRMDLSSPGEMKMFYPREKKERGAVINKYPSNYNAEANINRNAERSSALENKIMGPTEFFKDMSAQDIYDNILKPDKYYNPELPLNFMVPSMNSKTSQELANITNQPVRSYEGDHAFYGSFGLTAIGAKTRSGVLDPSKRDIGKVYYPQNYKPKTEVVLNEIDKEAPWLSYASSQRGVKESGMTNRLEDGVRQASNSGPEIDVFLKSTHLGTGNAWCASFVNWSMEKAGLPGMGRRGALAASWKNYGQLLDKPAYGSIATKQGHTAFVVGVDADDASQIIILGGNQGDSVNYMKRPLSEFTFTHPSGFTPNYNLPKYDLKSIGYDKEGKLPFTELPERARVK